MSVYVSFWNLVTDDYDIETSILVEIDFTFTINDSNDNQFDAELYLESENLMKKRVIISIVMAMIIFCGVIFFLEHKNTYDTEKDTQNSIESEVVLASSKEGYNSVVVYQLNNALIVSAESEAAFFDGVRYEVETQGNVDSSDIDIVWTNIGGGTEKTEDNDLIIAEIKISENGKLISDTKINFAKKAFDALEDVLKSNKR